MPMPPKNSAARELRRSGRCGPTVLSIITFSREIRGRADIRRATGSELAGQPPAMRSQTKDNVGITKSPNPDG
jgi:hypothetical protein